MAPYAQYRTAHRTEVRYCNSVRCGGAMLCCYAMSGTEQRRREQGRVKEARGEGERLRDILSQVCCYAVRGTELRYAAMRRMVLSDGMLLWDAWY
eukprot:352694-Rhodomonas_salina.1